MPGKDDVTRLRPEVFLLTRKPLTPAEMPTPDLLRFSFVLPPSLMLLRNLMPIVDTTFPINFYGGVDMEQHNSTYLMAEALEIFSALSPENQRKAILFLADLAILDMPSTGDPEEGSCIAP